MQLSPAQIKYIKERRKQLQEMIKMEPKYGLFRLYGELDSLNTIVTLHNIAFKEKQDASTTDSTSK